MYRELSLNQVSGLGNTVVKEGAKTTCSESILSRKSGEANCLVTIGSDWGKAEVPEKP